MPTNGNILTYEFLDQMSTEQLLDLIRADFESSEEGDTDLILRILEVIEEREKEQPSGTIPDVEEAWERFQKYFNTPDGAGRSLYPTRDFDLKTSEEQQDKPSKRRHKRLAKRFLPLAAAVAVAFSSMAAAQAFGFDIFGALARWTEETFHFSVGSSADETSPESEALRQAVQGAFDGCGVTIPAPAWYPAGTTLAKDIKVVEESDNSMVLCEFQYGDKMFSVIAHQYYEEDRISGYTFEKDEPDADWYPSNGRRFYVMSNLGKSRATYSDERTVVISISGELSLEDLKKIIDSIGE